MSQSAPPSPSPTVFSSGIEGLDHVLEGGFRNDQIFLVQGDAGTGKTTLGLHFVREGLRRGESTLYVTLAETEKQIRRIAASHGWSNDAMSVFQLESGERRDERAQTILHPAQFELPAAVDALLERVEAVRPQRLVIDSLSELRILALEPRWFRRELLRLRERLEVLDCSVLLLDTATQTTTVAESLFGGVLRLEREIVSYGPDRRRLHVRKIRGQSYQTGLHDLCIRTGGVFVYPRLVAADTRQEYRALETITTGLPDLDRMLGGGLDRGVACLLLGPTGTGKSTIAMQCAAAAAERGEHVLLYVFDERLQTVFHRARSLGIALERFVEDGSLVIRQIDPAELTAGEFADEVRRRVSSESASVVLIDSLNGYLYAMPGEGVLNLHLHELLAYLSQQGVTSIMVGTQHGLASNAQTPTDLDVSYLADTVIHFRGFELRGVLRKTIRVHKRRAGGHEHAIRELEMGPGGLSIGDVIPVSSMPEPVPAPQSEDPRTEGGREAR